MTGLDANGLQVKDSFPAKPEAVLGEAVLPRHFPAAGGNRSRSSAGPRPANSIPPCPPPPGSTADPR